MDLPAFSKSIVKTLPSTTCLKYSFFHIFDIIILFLSATQVILVSIFFEVPEFWGIITFFIILIFFALSKKFQLKQQTLGLFEYFWVTWSFGGLGMLLGHQIDALFSHTSHYAHQGHTISSYVDLVPFLLSYMTILMLAFCIPACMFICWKKVLRHINLVPKCFLHFGSSLFMLLGMLIAATTTQWLFLSNQPKYFFDYYFMLLSMTISGSIVYYIILRIIPLEHGIDATHKYNMITNKHLSG